MGGQKDVVAQKTVVITLGSIVKLKKQAPDT